MAIRPTMNNILSLGDFMVSNLWYVDIMPNGWVFMDGADFNFRAISSEVPKRTGTPLEINIRGQKVRQPGDYEYSGSITFTLVEDERTQAVQKAIRFWRERIIRTDTNFQDAKQDITATLLLRRLNRQNRETESWNYRSRHRLGRIPTRGISWVW